MTIETDTDAAILHDSEWPPTDYSRAPSHEGMIADKDIAVAMRDGVKLSIDVYRPETEEKLPVLLAFAVYNKDAVTEFKIVSQASKVGIALEGEVVFTRGYGVMSGEGWEALFQELT